MHKRKSESAQRPDPIDSVDGPLDHEWAALTDMLGFNVDEALGAVDDVRVREHTCPPIEMRTRHTTIRIPADVLNAFRREAARRGVPYQTLMIEALRTSPLNIDRNASSEG